MVRDEGPGVRKNGYECGYYAGTSTYRYEDMECMSHSKVLA